MLILCLYRTQFHVYVTLNFMPDFMPDFMSDFTST